MILFRYELCRALWEGGFRPRGINLAIWKNDEQVADALLRHPLVLDCPALWMDFTSRYSEVVVEWLQRPLSATLEGHEGGGGERILYLTSDVFDDAHPHVATLKEVFY